MREHDATRNILLVDKHPIIRWAFDEMLFSQFDIHLSGEACSPLEAILMIESCQPDLVVTDLCFDEQELQMLMDFTYKHCLQTLAFSDMETCEQLEIFFRYGGMGYVSKRAQVSELNDALQALADNKRWIPREIRSRLRPPIIVRQWYARILTSKELEVVSLITKGFSVKEVADLLYLNTGTIENHLYSILQKLNICYPVLSCGQVQKPEIHAMISFLALFVLPF